MRRNIRRRERERERNSKGDEKESNQNHRNITAASQRADKQIFNCLNHLFMTGKGVDGPADYEEAGNIDEKVLRRIVDWINKKTGI